MHSTYLTAHLKPTVPLSANIVIFHGLASHLIFLAPFLPQSFSYDLCKFSFLFHFYTALRCCVNLPGSAFHFWELSPREFVYVCVCGGGDELVGALSHFSFSLGFFFKFYFLFMQFFWLFFTVFFFLRISYNAL